MLDQNLNTQRLRYPSYGWLSNIRAIVTPGRAQATLGLRYHL